jgi:hypothetical protein
VHESVTISHRGRSYEIGRGPGFYGIWPAGASALQPIEWWPETPQGWHGAWSRFTGIEAPDAITAVSQAPVASAAEVADLSVPPVPARGRRLIGPVVLAIGVIIGIASLFPAYLGGLTLVQQPSQLVLHAIILAAWTAGTILLLLRGSARPRVGALVALGTSVVAFGQFFDDLAQVISNGTSVSGTGLVLGLIGWLVCLTGSVLAFVTWRAGKPARPLRRDNVLAVALAGLAALGAALAFAAPWDSYTLRTAAGDVHSLTAGNAFLAPAPLIIANVATMVTLLAVVVIAAMWQPIKLGAALLAGAAVPMVAQVVSAVIQARAAVSPEQFQLTPAQAAQIGLTITSGLTPAFWIFCAFVLALVLLSARMLTTPATAPPAPASAMPLFSAMPVGATALGSSSATIIDT